MFEAEIKYSFHHDRWPEIRNNIKNLPLVSITTEQFEDIYYDSKDGDFL